MIYVETGQSLQCSTINATNGATTSARGVENELKTFLTPKDMLLSTNLKLPKNFKSEKKKNILTLLSGLKTEEPFPLYLSILTTDQEKVLLYLYVKLNESWVKKQWVNEWFWDRQNISVYSFLVFY